VLGVGTNQLLFFLSRNQRVKLFALSGLGFQLD